MLQRYCSKNRNLSIFVISLAALHLSYADKYAQNRSISYCNQVIDGTGFVLVPGEKVNNNDERLEGQLYEFAYELKMVHESCQISYDRGLLIEFEHVTKVSEILIDETALGKNLNAIKVLLRRGANTVECKYSVGDIIELSNGLFANFSCSSNDAYQSNDTLASNAIEIRSIKPDISLNLANLKAEGSFGWLFIIQQGNDDSSTNEADSCPAPELYPGQKLSPEKQVYQLGEVVTFSCPDDSVLESPNDVQRTCHENGKWSDDTPKCSPQRQWYESIVLFNQEFTPSTRKENVSLAAHFNRDFFSINEITIDFAEEFNLSEWKRRILENAIFHVSDSNNNILRSGPLSRREPSNRKWDSITVSAQNFVQSPCTNCSVGVTFRNYHWEVPIVKTIRVFGSTFSKDANADKIEKTQCPPITPYYGMPDAFKSYDLVADGSINDQLLTSPCREGFKFVGKLSEISQCKDGAWQGSGFPDCEAIRVKSPPEVEHASWVYIQNNGQHETVYICDNGYYATGERTKAVYSLDDDKWTNVPQCEQVPQLDTLAFTLVIVFSVAISILLTVALVAVCMCKSLRKRNNSEHAVVTSASYGQLTSAVDHDEENAQLKIRNS